MKTVYDFTVKDRKGKDVSLKEYANEVLLIVNTATKCGFTPQYDELEKLYENYHSQGFEILDFPCNQFAMQAPGSADKIATFCQSRYGTTFKQFKKIKVNGFELGNWRYGAGIEIKSLFCLKKDGGTKEPSSLDMRKIWERKNEFISE